MSKFSDNEVSTDLIASLKMRYNKRVKEIQHILKVLNIKLEDFNEFKRIIQNCVLILMKNGADNVNRVDLIHVLTKRMLEHTMEVNLATKLRFINMDLEYLMHDSSGFSRQIRSDIRHYKNARGKILITQEEKSKNEQECNEELEVNYKSRAHSKVLHYKQQISLKRTAIKKLLIDFSKFEGLPPDVNIAKKLIEEKKLKLEMINKELELKSGNSIFDSSISP